MTTANHSEAQADALVARYHAAQAELDAHAAISVHGAARQSLPSEQARANILAHAAQLAQSRAAESVTADAIYSGAAYAHGKRATGTIDNQNEAANDNRWKIRALASVAVLGLTGLLFMQWDRGTPQEKEVAFSMERTAPAAPAATPPPPVATAPLTPVPAQPPVPASVSQVSTQPNPPADAAAKAAPAAPPDRVSPSKARPIDPPRATADAAPGAAVADVAAANAVQVPQPQTAPAGAAQGAPPMLSPPAPTTAMAAESAVAAPPPPVAAAGAAARAPTPMALPQAASANKALGAAPSVAPQARRDAAPARLMSPNAALFAAIREADAASLQFALTRGADKNAQSGGTPAVTLCVQANQPTLVRLLAAAGADLNTPDALGVSPMAHAQTKGLDEMVKLLLELGAK